jgi:hypothetical protein
MRMNRLRGVQGAEAGEEAYRDLLEFVRGKNLAAAEHVNSHTLKIITLTHECERM